MVKAALKGKEAEKFIYNNLEKENSKECNELIVEKFKIEVKIIGNFNYYLNNI